MSPARQRTSGEDRLTNRRGAGPGRAGNGWNRNRSHGFTLIELLTVIAIIGVLATLTASALARAKTRSHEAVCTGNLRQVALALDMYLDDTGRRPRAVSRLTQKPGWLGNPKSLLCAADATSRSRRPTQGRTNAITGWGAQVNLSQIPASEENRRDPDGLSWETLLRERTETADFSYLHPLPWHRDAWDQLASRGNQHGVAVCQLHGVLVTGRRPVEPSFRSYEGKVLRGQRDGAVVRARVLRGERAGVVSPVRPEDYPWDLYMDQGPQLR
jgi:prepilin-type N-terminal cleavage/methylation domain-containing protein